MKIRQEKYTIEEGKTVPKYILREEWKNVKVEIRKKRKELKIAYWEMREAKYKYKASCCNFKAREVEKESY